MINTEVLTFIKFATDNNEFGLANAMIDEQIVVRKGEDIKARLYKLFIQNRAKFIKIMRNAGFNKNAKNYTTEPNTLRKLANSLASYKAGGAAVQTASKGAITTESAKEWYDTLLGTLVGGGESSGSETTTTTEPAVGSQTKIIMVAVLVIGGIGALIYFLTK